MSHLPLASLGPDSVPASSISTTPTSLTRIKVDVGSGTRCQEGYRQWPAQGLLIIEYLKLIQVGVAKELTSQGVLIPGQKTLIRFKRF